MLRPGRRIGAWKTMLYDPIRVWNGLPDKLPACLNSAPFVIYGLYCAYNTREVTKNKWEECLWNQTRISGACLPGQILPRVLWTSLVRYWQQTQTGCLSSKVTGGRQIHIYENRQELLSKGYDRVFPLFIGSRHWMPTVPHSSCNGW